MIRVKFLLNNEVAIIDETNVVLFNNIGKVIKENAELIPKYANGRKILRLLRRDGKFENTRFNQLLFIYTEGTQLQDKIKNLQVQEC